MTRGLLAAVLFVLGGAVAGAIVTGIYFFKLPPAAPIAQNVPGNKITDASLANLKGMKSLRTLQISDNKGITDKGEIHLTELKDLEEIVSIGTGMTQQGIEELKKALPKTKISTKR